MGSTFPPALLGLALDQQDHEVGSHVCGSWGLLSTPEDDEQEEKANPKAVERKEESFWDQKQVVREPRSEISEGLCPAAFLLPFPTL